MTESDRGVWRPAAGAVDDVLAALAAAAPIPLPKSYLDLLGRSDGGEGDLSTQPGWICFWPAATVIAANADYNVVDFLPGFFAFGSSGGGEMYAFDARGQPPFPVVAVPFIPMDPDEAIPIADSFDDLVRLIGKAWDAA